MASMPQSIDDTHSILSAGGYVADRSLATVLYLSLKMSRPLFLEGEAGVGKTEIAKVLSSALDRPLIRLQCYEGLDVASAVYEWNYAAQMVEIRMREASGGENKDALQKSVFSEEFLIKRPLLQALEGKKGKAPVLLIDELDRTDEAFEAFLLEILSDFQVTIPELGTVAAEEPPIVIITTNRTREIHDALKRRCLYHWVDYPDAERELAIIREKVPGCSEALSKEIVAYVQKLREQDLFKNPGVAETLDWASALIELDKVAIDPKTISDTVGVLLKYQDDIARITASEGHEILKASEAGAGERMNEVVRHAGPQGRLPENILYFARALRAAGMKLGPASVVDSVKAVTKGGISDRDDFYWTLHCVLVSRYEDHVIFDQAFGLFWRSRELVEKMLQMFSPQMRKDAEREKPKAGEARVSQALFCDQEPQQEFERPEVEVDASFTTSDKEVFRDKDFAQMSAEELAKAREAMARMRLPLNEVRTRRFRPVSRNARPDQRRMLSRAMRTGGDLILPQFREVKRIEPPVVILADISGSMSQYSRTFLHFFHALCEHRRRVHTFLFGTRLTNVTRQLRNRDIDVALDDCAAVVDDWSGGTRIGETLHEFNRLWSRRVLGQGAVVLLITDGLERSDDDRLALEMDRLHRSCRRLIWLNPLLRFEGFKAAAHGIRTMLPHVDEFRPVHSISALADLCLALDGDSLRTGDPRNWLCPSKQQAMVYKSPNEYSREV